MYYDDEDDDPYTPRIGPAAMPSPHSEYAPYYSGRNNMFEDFLEEFEGLAYDCALTDPQRVDAIIRYFDPSIRELCRPFNGFRSRNWPLLRQSLINIFGSITPHPQVMRQRLLNYVQDSSRARMNCTDDVSQYYRQFLCLGEPLVHSGHLSKEERDIAFLCGFHPEDREVLRPRLLGKCPLQPLGIPFHFEDVLGCARAAFVYDGVSLQVPSWSSEHQFEPSNARREQLVAEHGSRDTYGLREVTRAVASNATTTPDDSSLPSHSTPDPQLPSSSSPLALESQHGLVHSVMLDQPETASTLLPSASPALSRSRSHLLAPSAAADVPEISFTHSLSSTAPTPSPISSDFEYLPSATIDQPTPMLSSTPPSASSISSTFLPSPACLATEDQPEPESASTPSITPSSLYGKQERAGPIFKTQNPNSKLHIADSITDSISLTPALRRYRELEGHSKDHLKEHEKDNLFCLPAIPVDVLTAAIRTTVPAIAPVTVPATAIAFTAVAFMVPVIPVFVAIVIASSSIDNDTYESTTTISTPGPTAAPTPTPTTWASTTTTASTPTRTTTTTATTIDDDTSTTTTTLNNNMSTTTTTTKTTTAAHRQPAHHHHIDNHPSTTTTAATTSTTTTKTTIHRRPQERHTDSPARTTHRQPQERHRQPQLKNDTLVPTAARTTYWHRQPQERHTDSRKNDTHQQPQHRHADNHDDDLSRRSGDHCDAFTTPLRREEDEDYYIP
ncbi:hypothetical protein EDB85DRAFT_2296239 [Lactarius pseudohatsudake]|nr:hypothetical protein EDB85DRAFT_2296239 [Lactarius pseudohatsudake]